MVAPITAGRDKSIQLLTQAYKEDRIIGVLSQKEIAVEDPTQDDLYTVGTVAKIMRMIKLPDGNITVILQGMKRFKVKEFVSNDPYFKAEVEILTEKFRHHATKNIQLLLNQFVI